MGRRNKGGEREGGKRKERGGETGGELVEILCAATYQVWKVGRGTGGGGKVGRGSEPCLERDKGERSRSAGEGAWTGGRGAVGAVTLLTLLFL